MEIRKLGEECPCCGRPVGQVGQVDLLEALSGYADRMCPECGFPLRVQLPEPVIARARARVETVKPEILAKSSNGRVASSVLFSGSDTAARWAAAEELGLEVTRSHQSGTWSSDGYRREFDHRPPRPERWTEEEVRVSAEIIPEWRKLRDEVEEYNRRATEARERFNAWLLEHEQCQCEWCGEFVNSDDIVWGDDYRLCPVCAGRADTCEYLTPPPDPPQTRAVPSVLGLARERIAERRRW